MTKQHLKNERFILFDFDGVIVDSFDLAYNVCKKIDASCTKQSIRALSEGNIHDTVKAQSLPLIRDTEFYEEYIDGLLNLPVYDGMMNTITELNKHYTLLIVTSSLNAPVQSYLEKHHLYDYFSTIMGADVHTSKIKKIQMVLDDYKLEIQDCIFVTDTLGDMNEATNVGVSSIGVTWGFHFRKTLEKGNPHAIVETPQELLHTIN